MSWSTGNAASVLLAGVLASAGLACSPAVGLKSAEEVAAAPPELKAAGGDVPAEASHRILQALSRGAGASEFLLRHVAVEEAYTASPLVMGNRVQLLRDGPEAYRAMIDAIRSARHHVNLEVYTFQDDEVGRKFADALAARVRAGVAVNVIYDSVGCLETAPEFFDGMRRAGIRVVEFNPVSPADARGEWRIEHRDHRKLLIVDNRVAFTGGINISTEYSGSVSPSSPLGSSGGGSGGREPWRDTQVRIEGPVVAEFQKLFRRTWEKQHGDPLPWKSYFRPVREAGDHIVRALGSTPDDKVSVIHTTLVSAVARAERSIHVTQMYFLPDAELLREVKAAARRGVDVRFVLPGEGFWLTRYAGRAHFSELLDAGVRVYERKGPLLHAKTAVIDGVWSTVGSANIDWRSLVKNDEVNAVILGEEFASELEAMFELDLEDSTEMTRKSWRKRGLSTRARETFARLWRRFL